MDKKAWKIETQNTFHLCNDTIAFTFTALPCTFSGCQMRISYHRLARHIREEHSEVRIAKINLE
jgi:hypothetical protein